MFKKLNNKYKFNFIENSIIGSKVVFFCHLNNDNFIKYVLDNANSLNVYNVKNKLIKQIFKKNYFNNLKLLSSSANCIISINKNNSVMDLLDLLYENDNNLTPLLIKWNDIIIPLNTKYNKSIKNINISFFFDNNNNLFIFFLF